MDAATKEVIEFFIGEVSDEHAELFTTAVNTVANDLVL